MACTGDDHEWPDPMVLGIVTSCECGEIDAQFHHNLPGADHTTQFTAVLVKEADQ